MQGGRGGISPGFDRNLALRLDTLRLIGGDGMKLSTERILTTHVGSLARPPDLFDMLAARASGQPYDAAAFDARARQAIADVVRRQAELGIDIIDDGEQGKPGFVAYISERLAGFEAQPVAQSGPTGPEAGSRELQSFPEFYAQSARRPAASDRKSVV